MGVRLALRYLLTEQHAILAAFSGHYEKSLALALQGFLKQMEQW